MFKTTFILKKKCTINAVKNKINEFRLLLGAFIIVRILVSYDKV